MAKKDEPDDWSDIKTFTAVGARIGKPKITLTGRTFLFNAAFEHLSGTKNKTHVILSYSKNRNEIVFQFTEDAKANGALKLVHRSAGSSTTSSTFFNYNFIDPAKVSGSYEPRFEKIPKLGDGWVINLNNKLPTK